MGRAVAEKGRDKVLVLVKALPHAGSVHGETVCCAGVTIDRQWRRLFPIHFRSLRDNKFARWQWIEYEWRKPDKDARPESRRVQEETIALGSVMPTAERAPFLKKIISTLDGSRAKTGSNSLPNSAREFPISL